jgi:hypothetical protein
LMRAGRIVEPIKLPKQKRAEQPATISGSKRKSK